MDLSIIIVNYKTPLLVMDCLQSIFKNTKGISLEVIVVDNDSGDDMELMISESFPQVRFFQMKYNAGFARANNEGMRQAEGEAVLLLNSDTIVEDDTISKCCTNLLESAYVACGVQLLNPDRSPQLSGFYAVKGGLNFLLQLPYAGNWIRVIGSALHFKKPNVLNAASLVEVDWINGAFLMVKKRMTDIVGLMDEDFFLYAEEAEWCSRLKKAGRLCIYGDLHIIHILAGSAMQSFGSKDKAYSNLFDKKGLQIMVSTFLRIRKEFGTGWFLFILLIFILEIPLFLPGVIITAILPLNHKYSFNEFGGYARNVGKTISLSPKIVRNKPWFYKLL